MAQSGYTPISLYYTTTAAAVPTSGNLVAGELALNTNDGKLYYKNSSGVVTLLAGATAGPAGGSTTQVQYNNAGVLAGITGATTNGTALTLSSALTYGGVTLANSVTGTGSMMLAASPTTTGTLTAAAINASGTVAMAGAATVGTTLGVTGTSTMAAINASGSLSLTGALVTIAPAASNPTLLINDPTKGSAMIQGGVNTGATALGDYWVFNVPTSRGLSWSVNNVSVLNALAAGVTIPGTLGVTGVTTIGSVSSGIALAVTSSASTYTGSFINSAATSAGLLVKAGSTSGHEVLDVQAYNATSLLKVVASGAVTIPGTLGVGGVTSSSAKVDSRVTDGGNPGSSQIGITAKANFWASSDGFLNGSPQIAFGFGATYAPAAIGMVATSQASFTCGDLVFSTRSVTTDTQPTERMRITSTGYSKITSTGSILNIAGPYHEIMANPNGTVCGITNSASTLNSTITGLNIYYQNTAPNSTVACFLYNEDTGGQRSAFRSNGGLANYSANDVNLSDETVKSDFIAMPSFRDEFAAMHGKWTRYKYLDQTHSDYNSGYRAQDIREVFGAKAPELVDWWATETRIEVEDAETGEKTNKMVPIPESERKLAVYNDDLHNIAMSVLSELIIEQNALRSEFQSYKNSHP